MPAARQILASGSDLEVTRLDYTAGDGTAPPVHDCDHHSELTALGAAVYGLSTQDTEYQAEAVRRLHLLFPLLSDAQRHFARALRLPTFTVGGLELIKRLTIIARAGRIEEVLYPVFPPDADAEGVITWLTSHSNVGTPVK